MKILVLNPNLDTLRQFGEALRLEGAVVLEVQDSADVLPVLTLHGRSVDLAVLHREASSGRGDVGAQLVREIRASALQADLPLVLTSQNWGDAQFAQHQSSPQACHAYLKTPTDGSHLIRLVERVLGSSLMQQRGRDEDSLRGIRGSVGAPNPASVRTETGSIDLSSVNLIGIPSVKVGSQSGASPSLVLEDASGLYSHSKSSLTGAMASGTITLDAPLSFGKEVKLSQLEVSLTEAPAEIQSGLALAPEGTAEAGPLELSTDLQTLSLNAGAADELPPQSDLAGLAPSPVEPVTALLGEKGLPSASPREPVLLSTASEHEIRQWMQPPIDDAIVPGGAAQSPDLETLKKYLLLREQDVAALSSQLRSARQRVHSLEDSLEVEKARSGELAHENERQKQRISDFELEKQALRESADDELNELRLQLRARGDKLRYLELQVKEASGEMDQLRERVRQDLRRIRVREQELENRLELLKRDSAAQLTAREEKLNEVRRRSDMLEFNAELLQTQLEREKDVSRKLREQLAQVSRMVRLAGGMLEGDAVPDSLLSALRDSTPLEVGPGPEVSSQNKKTGRAA